MASAPSVLESIEELSEIIEDPKLAPVPSVLDSIEELDNIMENGFAPVAVAVEPGDREEDQTEEKEIFFKKDWPERSREEVLDEDTMPEFETNQAPPKPQFDQVATNKKDIVGRKDLPESQVVKIVGSPAKVSPAPSVAMEDDYDQDDDYCYEEDEEDYDEEITKLQNQIDSIITSKSAGEESGSSIAQEPQVTSSGNKKRAREDPEGSGQSQKKPKLEEIRCYLCQKSLKGVNDFLQHLSRSHHGKDLFSLFPLNEGETCKLCLEEKKEKSFVYKKGQRSNYTLHLGKNHFRVLLFVPEEFRENLVKQLLEAKVKPEELSFLQSEGGKPVISLDETSAPPSEDGEGGLDTTGEEIEIQLEGEAWTGEPPALELEEYCSKEPQGESKAKAKARKSIGGCRCSLCDDETEYPRWKLTTHLVKHFDKELSKAYVDEAGLVANDPCPVCIQEKKSSPFVFTTRTHYIRHVGSAHGKVVDFVPEDHTQMLRFLRGDREGNEKVESCGEKIKKSSVEKKVSQEVASKASGEGEEGKTKNKKSGKQSADKESAKPRKKQEKNDPTEKKTDPPAPAPANNKSLIPVFQKGKKTITNKNPNSKPSGSKEPSILQCGECPAALTSKSDLLKHMKSHISK